MYSADCGSLNKYKKNKILGNKISINSFTGMINYRRYFLVYTLLTGFIFKNIFYYFYGIFFTSLLYTIYLHSAHSGDW